jgi:transmembrane sensor
VLLDPGPPRRFPAPPAEDPSGQAPSPPAALPQPPAPEPSAPEAPAPPARAPAPPRQRVGTWRALADQGDYERAWAALQREDGPRDEPVDLLRAADVARLTGHGAQAVPPLERMVSRFPVDPRAALAAFTLGRVYLEDLGQPRQAAAAFERARRFSPTGPLAADALAREVESHARAGDSLQAQSAARRYLEAYPTGARADAVRRWGGLPAR